METAPAASALYDHVASAHAETDRIARPYQQVADEIEAEIRTGRLVRGQKLPTERQLAAHFGVGRGVVREAVKVLGAMGLVEARQGSGIYIRNNPLPSLSRALTLSVQPDKESILSLFEFRAPLESLAAELAAARRTPAHLVTLRMWVEEGRAVAEANDFAAFDTMDARFHVAVAEASGNPYLHAVLGAVLPMRHIITYLIHHAPGPMLDTVEHHARLTNAIAAGDAARASALMRADVLGSAGAVRAALAARDAEGGSDGGNPDD